MLIIFLYFVDLSAAIYSGAIYYICEFMQYRIGRKYIKNPSKEHYAQMMIASTLAVSSVLLPVVMMWHLGTMYPRVICVTILTATFLHVALIRSPHLRFAVVTAIPLICAFYYLIVLQYFERNDVVVLLVSLLGVTAFNAYFMLAVFTYNRFQRALLIASDTARAASTSKSQFLATMSHELRTPLNAIMGVSQLLHDQPHHPASAVRIAALQRASFSLKALVDDVLDLTRIEQGMIELRPVRTNLKDEISAIAELHRSVAISKGLSFELRFARHIPQYLVFDPLRVRQCATNLLNNALKFTDRGNVSMTVRTAQAQGDEVRVEIEVSDTGIGVPPGMRHHLFESGYQSDIPPASPTCHRPSGAGLGLSISRMLARQMGGDITLVSQIDAQMGATFRFTFTAQLAGPKQPDTTDTAANPLTMAVRNILVVDDIATNRMVAAAFVEAEGLNATQAASGAEALDLLARGQFDLVLLDMNMPQMSGLETFQAIRASNTAWASIPVIALTADAMPEDTARYLRAGLDGYLAKPLDKRALRAEVSAVFAGRINCEDRNGHAR
ncbi:response regulator [Pontivivens nitratireducens]|uniref:response regulator n=1 Tax=Pontivivens nitratireducens TaxID=2758038 RepID=UPI00163A4472|nr:response regulator [Pontibrevibacter nitratireducens]